MSPFDQSFIVPNLIYDTERYLKNRKFNSSLKNVAVWGYWKNTGMYGEGTHRENAPFFEALSGEWTVTSLVTITTIVGTQRTHR